MADTKSETTDAMAVSVGGEKTLKRSFYERYASVFVLIGAIVGIVLAVIISNWEPENAEAKANVILWAGLVGDLFIRSLKLIVLPLVFVNVILATVDMLGLGQAGSVGKYTFVLYILTTLSAACFGLISTLIFKGNFDRPPPSSLPGVETYTVALGCGEDAYLVQNSDGVLECTVMTNETDFEVFTVEDVNYDFNPVDTPTQLGISETLFNGVFIKLVSENIVGSFASSDFAGIVVFAIVFGIALHSTMTKRGETIENPGLVVTMFKELDAIFLKLINWVIAITPLAVVSLIIKAIGPKSLDEFSSVGWLIVTTLSGMTAHFLFFHVFIFFLITRRNPFGYLRFIIPAQLLAFASASSAATLPVTMDCVENSGEVPSTIKRFVLSLGATINMDGSGLYFPAAITFLAVSEGIDFDVGQYILMVLISTIGSAGAAPVPSASLVLILTAYGTITGEEDIPDAFAIILAVDFLQDRFRTVLNVTGDAMVSRMVASLSGQVPVNAVDEEIQVE